MTAKREEHISQDRRLRVAMLCSTCDGEDVGESWSSFQWASGMAEHCDLTVLTYTKRGHTPTSKQLKNARVIEWSDTPILGRHERFSAGAKPGWWFFYWRARRWLKKAIRRGEHFDLIHQVSPLALRHACPAAGLGVPYIIGPLAGSIPTPPAFRSEVSAGAWYTRLRALDGLRFQYDPLLRRGYAGAAAVIGVAPYVAEILKPIPIRRFEVMSETGVHTLPDPIDRSTRSPGPLRLLYVGRIVRTKGLRDAIRALAQLPEDCPVHLDVLGDGDDRHACEEEVVKLGVGDRITFHGKVPRERVNKFYRNAEVFLFPSFREPSGNVVFESMSFGLPVITTKNGGPGFVVDETCGIRIDPVQSHQFAADIAAAIKQLSEDDDLRLRLGVEARKRIESIALWPHKIEWMADLYRQVLEAERATP
ncbi:MAG: glycosyltransferase family 4 protein [Phycisphaerales bacterium JB065]